jgi:hypothetical protein
MMMGAGLLVMLVVGLILIGGLVLIVALIAGGRQITLFKSQTHQMESDHSPSTHKPNVDHKCHACGRTVKLDWNICPSCGAALT